MLIKCPECEREISKSARACPQCGRPNVVTGSESIFFGKGNLGIGFAIYLGLFVVGLLMFPNDGLFKIVGVALMLSSALGLVITILHAIVKVLQKL